MPAPARISFTFLGRRPRRTVGKKVQAFRTVAVVAIAVILCSLVALTEGTESPHDENHSSYKWTPVDGRQRREHDADNISQWRPSPSADDVDNGENNCGRRRGDTGAGSFAHSHSTKGEACSSSSVGRRTATDSCPKRRDSNRDEHFAHRRRECELSEHPADEYRDSRRSAGQLTRCEEREACAPIVPQAASFTGDSAMEFGADENDVVRLEFGNDTAAIHLFGEGLRKALACRSVDWQTCIELGLGSRNRAWG
ncbi:hypothetical protein BIW11_11250, partial [Tropilaelaps mercedesae]